MTNEKYIRINRKFGGALKLIENYIQVIEPYFDWIGGHSWKMNYTELGELLSKDDHFNSLSKLHKKRLIKMVNRMLYGDYIHKSLLPTDEIGLFSLHSELLRKWYRKNYDSGYYLKVIEPYLDCVNESYTFGNGKGKTKKYKLKEWIN